jgi:hypothetical protein
MDDATPALVVPSVEVVAVVRHAPVPHTVPDPLIAFVQPLHVGGALDDWLLTEDTLALAEPDVPALFARWRLTWEHSWVLDPARSLSRLASIAVASTLPPATVGRITDVLDPGTDSADVTTIDVTLPPAEALDVAAALSSLRDDIAKRGRTGYGFVDASPNRTRIGLAWAWSPHDGPEVLVADRNVEVSLDPDHGLQITVTEDDGEAGSTRLSDIEQVEIGNEAVVASGPTGSISLDLHAGRVLTWLLPGATAWRVRRVPEVVVWARTFAGVVAAADCASSLRQPMRLTSLRLIATGDQDRTLPERGQPRLESRSHQDH